MHETDKAIREGRIELDEELSLERRFAKLEEEIRREKERLEGELAKLMAQIESLPAEERPDAEAKLVTIKHRLRELADLDATIEIELDDERIGE